LAKSLLTREEYSMLREQMLLSDKSPKSGR